MDKKDLFELKRMIKIRYNNKIPAKYKIFFDKKSNVTFASLIDINYFIFNSYHIYK
jgi:hypothetical protein